MEKLLETFEALKQKNLSIDLTRGKPHSNQLDLSNDLMTQAVDPIGAVSYTHLTLPTMWYV